MSNFWKWVFGIAAGVLLLGLIFAGSASRQAYRAARGVVEQRVEVSQERIEAVADMATASVDLALELAGDLPVQQAKADLVKQDIEAISKRLQEAAELRGDAALARLDASIALFNTALETVEAASAEATDPVVKARLERIYGVLLATQEQITQLVVKLK